MRRISRGRFALALMLALPLAMAWIFVACDRPGGRQQLTVPLVAGPAQPRVSLAEAGIDPAAIEHASEFAGARGAQALIVARGGHVVFEKYWGDLSIDSTIRFDGMTPALTALLLGHALNEKLILDVDMPLVRFLEGQDGDSRTLRSLLADQDAETLAAVLERVSKQPLQELVAEWLWKPLGGGDLSFETRDEAPRVGLANASCCAQARIADWLRAAQLLCRDGVFEARQYAPPGFVAGLLRPARANSTTGYFTRVDGRFAARDVAWLGDDARRLWLVPSLDLVILLVGGNYAVGGGWNEAMIPDSIIRGSSGWRPAAGEGTDPKQYAPH